MEFSLIITTYNSPHYLNLVLRSVELQTIIPNEIIIADDGSLPDTRLTINEFIKKSTLNIIHSWQEDSGFRVARSRNKAIKKSNYEYIILIDGDTILHKFFLQDHVKNAKPGLLLQGGRVLLDKAKSETVLTTQKFKFSFFTFGLKNRFNSLHSNLLSRLVSKNKNHLRGIKTCNMSFFKSDFISVNGFNNEFVGWGREDSEFVIRLMNNGVIRKTLRFNAIQFHLWHKKSDKKSLPQNDLLLNLAQEKKLKWCNKGFDELI
jgi:glycosyltransferase involved in cell wall biosynthesis